MRYNRPAMALTPGTKLDHHEIIEPIGKGGMGEVYKARDLKLGRILAIKILPRTTASDPERLRRFEAEARSASALNHPNIVQIYDVGEHEGAPFIAMEYVEGTTLRELLAAGPLPADKLFRLASQLAEGLAKAHSAGILHRDLKPENIIVSRDGYVKILDFGLAKLLPSAPVAPDAATIEKATEPGRVLGTVGYMSPEQARGESLDHRSDQFSLGAILYEMATGRRAFERDSAAQTMAAIIEDEPDPVTVANPTVPLGLVHVIERCLEKAPSRRFHSTGEIAKTIRDQQLTVPPASPARHPLAAVSAVGLLAILLFLNLELFTTEVRDRFSPGGERRIESLVVLPLDNLSAEPDQEFFADGMTEAVIADLAKLGAFRVISRTSAMRYKNSDAPLPRIAKELGVDAVVEGSVLRAGDRVRITIQLIEGDTDEHLWAESYEGDLADVLGLQREVANAIAGEIGAVLGTIPAPPAPAIQPAAYDAYLRGNSYFHQRSLDEAIAQYQEAIRLAPEFASAHAGLGRAYVPRRQVALARRAAERALAIDPELAVAHAVLATVLWYEWQWQASLDRYRKALELDPNDADVHHSYSLLLSRLGRFQESIQEQARAIELDPMSATFQAEMGLRLSYAGRLDEAIRQLEDAVKLDPDMGHAHMLLAEAYICAHRYDDALETLERAARSGRLLFELDDSRALVAAYLGRVEEARSYLEGATALPASVIHLGLGETEEVVAALERAYQARDPDLNIILHHPLFAEIRDDPRLVDLVDRMGLAPWREPQ